LRDRRKENRVSSRQRLRRRVPDRLALERADAAWEHRRDAVATTIDRHFTASDARTKLRR